MSNRKVTILIVVAALLLFVANLTVWVWSSVIDSDGFTETAYAATTEEEVRHAIATIIVNNLMESTPIARALFGEQIISSLSGILASEPFHLTFDRIVATAHRILVSGSSEAVVIDTSTISRIVNVLILTLQSDSSEEPPRQMPTEVVLIEAREFPTIKRVVDVIPWLALATIAATLAVGGTAIYRAADRRRAMIAAGLGILGVAILTLAILLPIRSMVVNTLIIKEQRTIAGGMYDALLWSLRAQSISLAAIGAILIASTALIARDRSFQIPIGLRKPTLERTELEALMSDAVQGTGFSRDEMLEARRRLQEQFAPLPIGYSTDGQTFGFEVPLDFPGPPGSYVQIKTGDDRVYLGQIISKAVDVREGPELGFNVGDRFNVSLEGTEITTAALKPRIQFIDGTGVILGRIDDGVLVTTHRHDTFHDAGIAVAPDELVEMYFKGDSSRGGQLTIGRAIHGNETSLVNLRAGGFGRHTFLCGQSGSGKTYSLGVILEQLLLNSGLRMLIVDPNSDFVKLNQPRDDAGESFDQNHLDQYATIGPAIRVARPNAIEGEPRLAVRFSDLERRDEALVLQIDPLADREEYSSFWRIVEHMGGDDVTLSDILDVSMRDTAAESRNVSLRVRNLGIADWDLWCRNGEPSAADLLDEEWRAMVLDIGSLDHQAEKLVATLALLQKLWSKREERNPILIVIDEAHNVCPAEPETPLQERLTQVLITIAGEGRKFGLYLLLASQRPQKIHPNVLSQCDNLVLMRMNSSADLGYLSEVFSFIPGDLISESTHFRMGESLIAGQILQTPALVQIGRRMTREGGTDIPSDWAK